MYTFRPYELVKVNYKCYGYRGGIFDKGINSYPRPRSGHRIVCNDSDLYCFGGFNPNIRERTSGPIDRIDRTLYLFQELWKFDLFTKKWSKVYSSTTEGMPAELASNAVILRNNMLIVWLYHMMDNFFVWCLTVKIVYFCCRYLVEQDIHLVARVQISATCLCRTAKVRNQFLRYKRLVTVQYHSMVKQ